MSSSFLRHCDACAGSSTNHTALWISNSGDMLALFFAGSRNTWIVRTLSGIGEWAVSLLAHVMFMVGRAFGFLTLSDDITRVTSARSRVMWEDAKRRGIPMEQLYFFGTQRDTYRIHINGHTYFVDSLPTPPKKQKEALHVDDKISFKTLLRKANIPTPRSIGTGSLHTAKKVLQEFGTICVKPRYGSNGFHTFPHVRTETELEEAFRSAQQICTMVSVEEHLEGNLARATCVDGKLVGFLASVYPTVIGNGVDTIAVLIEQKNKTKQKGVSDIVLSSEHIGYIARHGYTPDSVL